MQAHVIFAATFHEGRPRDGSPCELASPENSKDGALQPADLNKP
jgi:hypothetical protein